MDSPIEDTQQQEEITVLKSIYGDDFIDIPPPKAWKGASRLPEFNLRIQHPDSSRVALLLNVKLPKTYPKLACPHFTIQKPTMGMTPDQVSKLSHAIQIEANEHKGTELVFQIATFVQDWLGTQVQPPVEVRGSLALQMIKRAEEEERMRKQKEEEEIRTQQARAAKEAKDLEAQVAAMAAEREEMARSRNRSSSNATEVPSLVGDVALESFEVEMELNGILFNTVKCFHPQPFPLGTVYVADPVCDDVNATLPLELFVIHFENDHYTTLGGKRKIRDLEAEIRKLTKLRHPNVLRVLGVKLVIPQSNAPPQLIILSEQAPPMTLHDVLQDCDNLREERALEYLTQILTGLDALHKIGLVHRGINPRAVYLASTENGQPRVIKLGKCAFYTQLLDLHRSASLSRRIPPFEEMMIPEAWQSKDYKASFSQYTILRDIHDVGTVFLQMVLGLDMMDRYQDVHAALKASYISNELHTAALSMISPSKKAHESCASILKSLALATLGSPPMPPRTPSMAIPSSDSRTPNQLHYGSSPEMEYFRAPAPKRVSRWKEDWYELETLGKGGFGCVKKARNKIDDRIYAVKQIRLRKSDTKIFREVSALSRLSHPNIVRYYTTWIEETEQSSAHNSDSESSGSGDADDTTVDGSEGTVEASMSTSMSVSTSTSTRMNQSNVKLYNSLDELRAPSSSGSSFPSIGFEHDGGSSSEEDTDSDGDIFLDDPFLTSRRTPAPAPPVVSRMMYIQMEFVERQTLKERIDEGLSQDEAWRLFQQIVDALVHMSSLGILHRDIKLTNIFIDAKGDCKVGDFGLATATSSLVDTNGEYPGAVQPEMTYEVGTKLYIAPELQGRSGPQKSVNQAKADMYSLGIVFFEMNYRMATYSERVRVLERLRQKEIEFPDGWNPNLLDRQHQIINWLLQHDPDRRPTALELSQSSLLPKRMGEEYFRHALGMMVRRDTSHHEALLDALFTQRQQVSRGFLYDSNSIRSERPFEDVLQKRLATIFSLHGAVDDEPPLLAPASQQSETANQAKFLDRHGDLVALPDNLVYPFARLAARRKTERIKRYCIADVYEPIDLPGHPQAKKAAIFDIVSRDLATGGLVAAPAELAAVADRILAAFPTLAKNYDLVISHSSITDAIMNRIPAKVKTEVVALLNSSKLTMSQKRTNMAKHGLSRTLIEELEVLSSDFEHVDELTLRLSKSASPLLLTIGPALGEVKKVMQYVSHAGVTTSLGFLPLVLLGSKFSYFRNGVLIAAVSKKKRTDVLAAGGRYDHLIKKMEREIRIDPICAYAMQFDVEVIKEAVAKFQHDSLKTLTRDERSYGVWSPRRCDVYVVPQQDGCTLEERMEIVSYLWENNISADVMYETSLQATEYVQVCKNEGILFLLYVKARSAKREQPPFRVKSLLKHEEAELSRGELIPWLRQEIAEQARLDSDIAGTPGAPIASYARNTAKQPMANVIQVLQGETSSKKHRKQTKHLVEDRAFDSAEEVRKSFLKPDGMPTIVVDVASEVFDRMIRGSSWVNDDDAWKSVCNGFPAPTALREVMLKRKTEGWKFVLMYLKREDRIQLLQL